MTYSEAKDLKEKKSYLIGHTDEKGFTIGDLVIVPSNPQIQTSFLRNYLFNRNFSDNTVLNGDVQLWGVDTNRMEKSGVLFYQVIKD